MVNWWAHGSKTAAYRKYWSSDDGDEVPENSEGEFTWKSMISTGDCSSLNNNYPSIIFACSCNNGWPESTNLGKSMIQRGSAGIVASSRVSWYTVGWEHQNHGGNASMNYYFFYYLINHDDKVGDALYNAKVYYSTHFMYSSWGYVTWQNMFDFNLYGDPSLYLPGINPPQVTHSVSGNIYYQDQGNKPIGNVSVELGGSQSQTDNNGSFTIEDVPGGNWALKPEKDGDLENSISPFDAAKVLQYSVGILTLTPYQMIAADVSGDGSVSLFDASYILQYIVGTLTEFPVGDDWKFIPSDFVVNESNWSSAPDSIYYEPLISDLTGQDFTGIVYGDVTGNWLEMTPQASASDVEFTIDAPEKIAGGKVNIPIRIKVIGEAYSGQLYLEFDNSQLTYLSCRNQNSMSNVVIASEENEGQIILAFASPLSIGGNELRLNLQFDLLHPESSMTPGLNLTEIKIDDKVMLPTVVNNLKETAIPNCFELYQNHPNPFNPETRITYTIAQPGQVKLTVYNVVGQKVATLVDEYKAANTYHVTFDANNLTSGVYFYRLEVGDYTKTMKMMLLR